MITLTAEGVLPSAVFCGKERKDGVYKEISVDELGPPCYSIILRGYAEYLRNHIPRKDL